MLEPWMVMLAFFTVVLLCIYLAYKMIEAVFLLSERIFYRLKDFEPENFTEFVCKWLLLLIFSPIFFLGMLFILVMMLLGLYWGATTVRDWWHAGDDR